MSTYHDAIRIHDAHVDAMYRAMIAQDNATTADERMAARDQYRDAEDTMRLSVVNDLCSANVSDVSDIWEVLNGLTADQIDVYETALFAIEDEAIRRANTANDLATPERI